MDKAHWVADKILFFGAIILLFSVLPWWAAFLIAFVAFMEAGF